MQQLVTLGETMVSFVPQSNESLQYGAALKMCIAGAESNTAVGIQKLGGTASYITRLGEDCFGQYILRMIRAEGVDTSNIKFDPRTSYWNYVQGAFTESADSRTLLQDRIPLRPV